MIHLFFQRDSITLFPAMLVNELHDWMDKHPHLIQYPNASDSISVEVNVTLVKKQNHLLQISVRSLHSDLILPVYQGGLMAQ